MKVLMAILISLAAIFAAFLIYLGQFGLFAQVHITEGPTGSSWLVYKKQTGDYKNTPLAIAEVADSLQQNQQLECPVSFGLFYDNPQQTPVTELRSLVGCVINSRAEAEQVALSGQWQVIEFPNSEAVRAEFPLHGQPSIMIGIFKVYPDLLAFIYEQGVNMKPIMEIYDQKNKVIHYQMSKTLDEQFFAELIKQ